MERWVDARNRQFITLTFLAVPRFEGAVVFLAGAAFLPARTFFGALLAAALVAAGFEDLATSAFFSTAFLGAMVREVVTAFVFANGFLTEADLAAIAFVGPALTGRAFGTDLGAVTLAGLF